MIRAHLDAVLALLQPLTQSPTLLPVIDAGAADAADEPPALPGDRPQRFVVVRPDSFPVTSDRLAQHSSVLQGRVYVLCAGSTLRQAQWAQEKTRTVLLDKRPVVTGRSVGRLSLVDSSRPEIDRDLTPPVFTITDIYALFST